MLTKIKGDGVIRMKELEFWYIVKDTKIGRIAKLLRAVTSIYVLELEKGWQELRGSGSTPSTQVFYFISVPSHCCRIRSRRLTTPLRMVVNNSENNDCPTPCQLSVFGTEL